VDSKDQPKTPTNEELFKAGYRPVYRARSKEPGKVVHFTGSESTKYVVQKDGSLRRLNRLRGKKAVKAAKKARHNAGH
jgi:hypothetical protein